MRITRKLLEEWSKDFLYYLEEKKGFILGPSAKLEEFHAFLYKKMAGVPVVHVYRSLSVSAGRSGVICDHSDVAYCSDKAFHVTAFPCVETTFTWCIRWDSLEGKPIIEKHKIAKCPHSIYKGERRWKFY